MDGMAPVATLDLRADCARCAGLCCVAPAFAASSDFAIDKDAGEACPNLEPDFRCRIHARLRDTGFPGCVAYDCFGAGQHVTQVTFGGRDWRSTPRDAVAMFEAFGTMRALHELAWYLEEALSMPAAARLGGGLAAALEQITRLAALQVDELRAVDVAARQLEVGGLLAPVSEAARADAVARARAEGHGKRLDRRGADLAGADLAGADLRGVMLRGATLIGANLREADLRFADLAGADLRGADLAGADLRDALFVAQSQLDSAAGDPATRLPPARSRPAHWVAATTAEGRGPG
jgi:uncharacterized protein YjbI with pentapeptide repeats